MFSSHSRHHSYRALICLTLMILFGIFGSLRAQDAPAADVPTETNAPTVEPTTETPTDAPTLETPTEIPTDAPTIAPTDVPTDAPTQDVTPAATEAATAEVTPTVVSSEPPVFNFANGTTFEGTAGLALVIEASVSDSLGVVRVLAEGSVGTVSLTTVEPTETAAPFTTLVTLTYTAGADFSGVDTVTLTAINAAGDQSSATLTINISLPVTPTPTLTPTPSPEPMEERVIKYNPAASEDSIQAMLASLGAIEISRLPQIGAMRVFVPESVSQPATAMATVQSEGAAKLAGVSSIEANINFHLMYTPTDPKFSQQWGLANTTGGIYAPLAWDASTTRGLGIKVAVLDSGVDLQHEDLLYQTVPGWDFVNDDNNPDDDNGHGTHVAGIIAARTINLKGIAGIAYNAKILPVKICDNAAACQLYYVAEGIIYATDMGAQIINLSLGSEIDSPTVKGAINYALSRNVVVVAAAGNCGDATNPCHSVIPPGNALPTNTLFYPASYPGVISVASHDETGTISTFSSFNAAVTISAPGENILSLYPKEKDGDSGPIPGDGYTLQDGTSMAAAFVSGTAALLMSAKIATTPDTVRDALICGAEDAGTAGLDDSYGYGRLKADMAMSWHLNGSGNAANCKVTLFNDDFQFAKLITVAPFSITQAISDRSVSEQATDPQICGASREQTLWYSYRPTINGYYQFSTLGSSYNTVLGVFRGGEGVLTSVGCTTTNKQVALPLDAAQTYFIAVGTNGAPVNDQVLQLRVNAAMLTTNLDYQETSVNIAYSGMWLRTYLLGSSGSYVQQTTDPNALAAFSFRGTSFDYVRTLGPDRGSMQVYVNGIYQETVSNWGAIVKGNQVKTITINTPTPAKPGSWNTVYLQRDPAVPGSVDVDRIRTYDFDSNTVAATITLKADDRDVRLRYSGTDWVIVSPGPGLAYLNTLKETGVQDATVRFRFSGNALTIFRMTGAGFASMQVTIDNGAPLTVINTAATLASRPYTINGLTTMTHVVEIKKLGVGGTIQLDAVQPVTMANLSPPYTYDDRSLYIAYRGTWTDTAAVAGAYALTTRSLDIASEASFKFLGNDLCIGYQRPNSPLNVIVDGNSLATIAEDSAGSGFTIWCYEATQFTLLADTVHYATLVAGDGVTTDTFKLDYVRPGRYATLTPARKIVQETDLAFRYSTPADWTLLSTTAMSVGGFRPQGGYLKRSKIDDTKITFYINGTGFIFYTTVAPENGCWAIKLDSNPPTLLMDSAVSVVNLLRYQPLGVGVTDLTPGIHRIELIVDANCSYGSPPPLFPDSKVEFDAVRVFP